MIDVSLLGTGGMMPLPKRHVTSLLLRHNGASVLIDCGEGTQIALRKKGWSFKPIEAIFLTHFHADHIAGLPGFLLTMGNAGKTDPLTIIGPKGTVRIVSAVRTLAPELPFEVNAREIEGNEETFIFAGLTVTAFRVQHTITCYAYKVELSRGGRFDPVRAREAGIPLKFWNPLQKGQICEEDGKTYTPDMVLGGERKGIKLVYATDTRPVPVIAEMAEGADLFICEGMYGEPDTAGDALVHPLQPVAHAAGAVHG